MTAANRQTFRVTFKKCSWILYLLIIGILSACSGQNDEASTPSPAPPKYQAPPIISTNSASFNGPRSNYTVKFTSNDINVIDNVGSDGNIFLATSVELLKFTDISINLAIAKTSTSIGAENLNSLIELYIAYFNRVPDAAGLSYWIDRFKAGMTLDQIGESFYAAGVVYSSQTGYTATMSNSDFVRIIYKNVLGRPSPDQEGVDYWSGRLDPGCETRGACETRGTLVQKMLNSAHTFKGDLTYGWVAQLLDNKASVSKEFFSAARDKLYRSERFSH
jgi:hypothetical protein